MLNITNHQGNAIQNHNEGEDQDGTVGGCEMNSTTQHEHIKICLHVNNSHRKLTADWQKDSCKTKAVRKTHIKSGRKGSPLVKANR